MITRAERKAGEPKTTLLLSCSLFEMITRAERKAGELLQQLERAPHDRGNQHVAKFQPGIQPESEYRAVLTDSDIAPTTAHRWQTVANHAAEVKLRAERKAGELLQQLERAPHDRGNQYTATSQPVTQPSEYSAVLEESDINRMTAHRWQTVAQVRALTQQKYIYVGLS